MANLEVFCHIHPDRHAIEHCEVCQKPLCGYCLYYTDDGQRLCEEHAQAAKANGLQIIPPAVYAAGIIPSQASIKAEQSEQAIFRPPRRGAYDPNAPKYFGNDTDMNAFLGMLLGVVSLTSMCGMMYCFPFVAVLLGLIGLFNAKKAIDPSRTRIQSIVALATGGIFVLGIIACIGLYVWVIVGFSTTASSFNTTPFVFPTDTITPAPTQASPLNNSSNSLPTKISDPSQANLGNPQQTATALMMGATATQAALDDPPPTDDGS